jgi:hypothetical protein
VLVPANAAHGLTSEAPALVQDYALAVANALHALVSQAPALVQTYTITLIDNTIHLQVADSPTFTLVLGDIDNAVHLQVTDFLVLILNIVINNTFHFHRADKTYLMPILTATPENQYDIMILPSQIDIDFSDIQVDAYMGQPSVKVDM